MAYGTNAYGAAPYGGIDAVSPSASLGAQATLTAGAVDGANGAANLGATSTLAAAASTSQPDTPWIATRIGTAGEVWQHTATPTSGILVNDSNNPTANAYGPTVLNTFVQGTTNPTATAFGPTIFVGSGNDGSAIFVGTPPSTSVPNMPTATAYGPTLVGGQFVNPATATADMPNVVVIVQVPVHPVAVTEGYFYEYENVGISTSAVSEADFYEYENVGFGFSQNDAAGWGAPQSDGLGDQDANFYALVT